MFCSVVALGPPCRWPRGRRGPHWARESGADRHGEGASPKCRSRSALPGRIVTGEEGDSIGFRQLVGTSFRRRGTGAECRRRWPWGREGAWLPATPPIHVTASPHSRITAGLPPQPRAAGCFRIGVPAHPPQTRSHRELKAARRLRQDAWGPECLLTPRVWTPGQGESAFLLF